MKERNKEVSLGLCEGRICRLQPCLRNLPHTFP